MKQLAEQNVSWWFLGKVTKFDAYSLIVVLVTKADKLVLTMSVFEIVHCNLFFIENNKYSCFNEATKLKFTAAFKALNKA